MLSPLRTVLRKCIGFRHLRSFTQMRRTWKEFSAKEDLLLLKSKLFGFILGAAVIVLAFAAIYLDINIVGSASSEASITEAVQEFLLLVCAVIYCALARKNKDMRPALVLVGGFFMCMLIRELDAWFGDNGLHWLPPALLVAGLSIFYAARRLTQSIHGLARFSENQSFTLLMSGLVTVLVFSRLFGMKAVWVGLLGPDYPRWVKIFAEEGLELFGYAQCFLATVYYAWLNLREKREAAQAEPAETPLVSGATERITS